ncbi:MAG: hypothetical protein EXQ52_05855 [Bryobacterales bacterium]|nr:hypothetical protein [Bryobacterales bacterium]
MEQYPFPGERACSALAGQAFPPACRAKRSYLPFALALLVPCAWGQYAGSEACRGCHEAQFAAHAKTGHAKALSRSDRKPGEWAFGAGVQAITFVSQADEDSYIEHGLSYYKATKSMALTPGHRSPEGERYRTFDPGAAIFRCFQCHATGPLKLAAGSRIEPSELGVQCESCHGPGAEHATSQRPIKNPKRLSAAELNDACGQCHRKPAAAGADTDWSNPWNARHQPLYLSQSACFRNSKGALSCLTCHAAHTELSRDSASYNRRCAGCHVKPKHRAAVAEQSCVGCHMPSVVPLAIDGRPALRFANHWIGIYSGNSLKPASSTSRRPTSPRP